MSEQVFEANQKLRSRPKLSFWQIWNMSFGFLGIQFGFALQNANTSRIFETLGAEVDELAVYWLAAPLTGLIIQPIVGYMSDRTWTRLGRRRPYFLIGAILASLALCFMPNSPTLWMAIGVLWIMDASINVSMEPFRAFVGDNLPDSQRTMGFAMQSFFIGIGGFIGSAMPYVFSNWFDISNRAAEGVIPDTVKYSFYIGASIYLLAVLWTVFSSKEYPPEEFERFEDADKANQMGDADTPQEVSTSKQRNTGTIMALVGLALTSIVVYNAMRKDLYILTVGIAIVGLLFIVASLLRSNGGKNGFIDIMTDLLQMPSTMKQLAWVQFFSWFAMFSMWIYATSAVTGHIYHSTDPTSSEYNEGADWVGWLMGIKFLVAACVAFLIPILAKKTNRRLAHLICLTCGGLGLISFYFVSNPDHLLISMIGVGVAWASILSIPYALLTGSLPSNKMGYYMGVFNFFIVIPQIVAASILGFILVNFFNNEPIYALVVGGVSMIIAGLLTLRVDE